MAYLGILLTAALYRTIDPCTVDRRGQLLTNMFQNAEHCLSKQVLSQHLTPQLSSIFPLSHLCLHKTQTHQGRQNCSAAQHITAGVQTQPLTAGVQTQLQTVTNYE